jgi:redox-sensitive bicupin YhaK (pirin superfamily)
MDVEVQRAEQRFRTDTEWLTSRHSFSFGPHFDPVRTGFGLLVAQNDDVVAPGTGFDTHPHRDTEIVTWVLSGSLVHADSRGNSGEIHPGLAQRMSAGSGILHSERNDRGSGPVHFVQMWVLPDEPGLEPSYQQRDVTADLASGALVPVASGLPAHRDSTAIRINQRYAGLQVARLLPGRAVVLPEAPYAHLFVAAGTAELESAGPLTTGDAAQLSRAPLRVTAGPAGAELLVWEMHHSG